jgi:ribosomal-protein-alanine N-acetyltransferase
MTPEDMARLHDVAFAHERGWSSSEFRDLLDDGNVVCIAETAGFIMGRAIAGEAEILTIATNPAARRRGTARRLMNDFEESVRALGCSRVFLEVAEDNAAAMGLYQGCGYTLIGRRKAYYARNDAIRVDALVMEKVLQG